MKRIDATCGSETFTFRTNDDGFALFIGLSENRQISCDSGFDSLRKIKRAIREHITNAQEPDGTKPLRIKYTSVFSAWRS